MSKIKVMHLIGSLRSGGAENLVLNIAKAINREKIELVVCSWLGGPLEEEFRQLGIRLVRGPRTHFYSPCGIRAYARLIKEEKINVLHTHLFDSDILGRLAGKLAGVPVLTTVHACYTWKRKRDLKSRLRTLLDRITANFLGTLLLATSESVKEYHIKYGKISGRKLQVLNNFVILSRFDVDKEKSRREKRAEFGIKEEAPLVINVANPAPVKGQDYLIRAFKEVGAALPEAMLMIVGAGEYAEHLKKLARDEGLDQKVIFTGRRDDVVELLAAADLFVLSSLSEGVSIALLEAMAMRLPVVVTDVGGNRDVVEDGVSGLIVPARDEHALAEKITLCLRDRELRAKLGEAGRRKVENAFSDRVVVRQLERIYEEISQGDKVK